MTDYTKLQQRVKEWDKAMMNRLRAKFDELDIEHRDYSRSPIAARDALKSFINSKFGMPAKISFKFPRHMVFVAKGVGRGVPASIAGSGATTRKPKDWFNSVLDPGTDELADIVAEETGDFIVNNLRIR